MTNVVAMNKELSLDDKSGLILEALFGKGEADEVYRVFLNEQKKEGKIYLPLCKSIAGLVNTPVDFKVKIEVREDKTVIYF